MEKQKVAKFRNHFSGNTIPSPPQKPHVLVLQLKAKWRIQQVLIFIYSIVFMTPYGSKVVRGAKATILFTQWQTNVLRLDHKHKDCNSIALPVISSN